MDGNSIIRYPRKGHTVPRRFFALGRAPAAHNNLKGVLIPNGFPDTKYEGTTKKQAPNWVIHFEIPIDGPGDIFTLRLHQGSISTPPLTEVEGVRCNRALLPVFIAIPDNHHQWCHDDFWAWGTLGDTDMSVKAFTKHANMAAEVESNAAIVVDPDWYVDWVGKNLQSSEDYLYYLRVEGDSTGNVYKRAIHLHSYFCP